MRTGFYSDTDLDRLTTLSRATRWRMRQSGEFPEPVRLSLGRVGYPAKQIDDWIEARLKGEPCNHHEKLVDTFTDRGAAQ